MGEASRDASIRNASQFVRTYPLPGPPLASEQSGETQPQPTTLQPDQEMPPKLDAPVMTQEVPQEAKMNISDLFSDSTPEQLEAGVEKGVAMLDKLKATLEARGAGTTDAAQWMQSIDVVRSQAVKTKTVVGVVGATGAGKSSIINAMMVSPSSSVAVIQEAAIILRLLQIGA
jgi:ABC-type glutathione transport system ATPase component